MATPIVRAIYGEFWTAPAAVNSGGTRLLGIDPARPIQLVQDQGVDPERHGLETDAIRVAKAVTVPPAALFIPAMGGDVATLKMLWAANTSDGAAIYSDGTGIVKGAHTGREFAAAVRPYGAGTEFWYFPRLMQHPQLVALLNRHPWMHQLAESNLVLMPCRPDNAAHPAFGFDVAATLNTLYGLGGA